MFCKNCGISIADNAKFCTSCGNGVSTPTEAPEQNVFEKNLKGLGGWLVLVILGLFTSVAFQAYSLYDSLIAFTDGTVDFLSDPSSEAYIPGYTSFLKFEFIASILLLGAGVYLIYLFFKKSIRFPRYYVSFLIFAVVYLFIDYVLLSSVSVSADIRQAVDDILSEQTQELGRSVISAVIWTSYMWESKRVKATFVEV